MECLTNASLAPYPASTAAPPALPPSVEEAYRRKCIQLKQRTSEVEEANDAARLRLARLKRQVEKMRLERAFLLEQLAKRTSTNVEDSDGSPSPPPTVSSQPDNCFRRRSSANSALPLPRGSTLIDTVNPPSQPKEKPLRIKRGHRKPSALTNLEAPSSVSTAGAGSTFISQNLLLQSPSSDAFSATQLGDSKTNGVHKGPPKKPGNAFDLYCDETRPSLKDKAKEGGTNMEEELSRRWKDLPDSQRDEYQALADRQMAEYEKEKDAYDAEAKASSDSAKTDEGNGKAESTESERPAGADGRSVSRQQEDVEMTNYDTDQETQGEKPEE
ncbi:Non-histone protein 10 [Achaetomium macrosporum]|uniref:Non-histone protein 10 n=1 Tax=Achaetomium macrosporum TaxID=79813 RepID=A0AAN7CD87_9PEZI|nr:Non-histone protein 10 [Achaetomium macrosporum]